MGWRMPGSRETLSGSSLKPAAASAALSASKEVAPQPRLRTCGAQTPAAKGCLGLGLELGVGLGFGLWLGVGSGLGLGLCVGLGFGLGLG